MRRAWTHGRRGALAGASAAAICLGGLLAACGGSDGDGYVAAGAAEAGPEHAPDGAVAPTDKVRMVPLDGDGADGRGAAGHGGDAGDGRGGGGDASPSSGADGSRGAGGDTSAGAPEAAGTSTEPAQGHHKGDSGTSGEADGTSSSAPGGASPPAAAELVTGNPDRAPADDRWCEKVTIGFHNTGGSPVRSGKIVLGTHIIGALGIDWATIESTEKLPAPIAAGEKKDKTWTVCVDSWRVPTGMHIETRDVAVTWSDKAP